MLTTSEEFFEQKYRTQDDPWNFAHAAYEQARYDSVIACLGPKSYHRAFEPGCSVGVLTERLAKLCLQVEACEISQTAVQRAQRRCASLPNVHIWHGSIRDAEPQGCDLLVLCEIGYYFTENEWFHIAMRLTDALCPSATVLACHWLGTSEDHLVHGDVVHQTLQILPGLEHEYAERHANFRLDRWTRPEKRR